MNRDFACMLTSEKKSYELYHPLSRDTPQPIVPQEPERSNMIDVSDDSSDSKEDKKERSEMHGTSDISQNDLEDLFEGLYNVSL